LFLLDWRVRRLIINADDFGLTPGVNRGIAEAHSHGVVTSSTLMASGMAFDDALQLAQSNPRLGIGCHAVLVDGRPLLSPHEVSSLIGGTGDLFRQNLSRFALRAIAGRLDAEQIEAEVTAQIRKLQSAGVAVSHLDTHKHVHIFPQVLRPLLRAAQACGVRAIRNPFGRVGFPIIASHPNLWKRYGELKLLNRFAGKFQQAVTAAGMCTTDGSLGIVATGRLDDRLFRFILGNVPDGTWELVSHPGYNDAELRSVRTRLRESRAVELRLLTSAETRELLARSGVELISYRDLI
jgi:hopanoid biosynthesis associated protein HpnK